VSLPSFELADDLRLALELADLADSITLGRYRAADLQIDTKPDLTPVTEADTSVERAIRDRLAQDRPGDSVVGEEYGSSTTPESTRRWIVDPIDGTKNFVRGLPVWATLLALQDGDELVLGVTSAPALHRRWWATRGSGSFVTDGISAAPRRLHVSRVAALPDAQVLFSELEMWAEYGGVGPLLELVARCWRSRAPGDFWNYMLVAEGVAEIALEPVVSLWDLAAVQVIVEEAGGRFTDRAGVATADGGDAVASNGLLHEAALEIVGR
jgi:histidinol-phosphatase